LKCINSISKRQEKIIQGVCVSLAKKIAMSKVRYIVVFILYFFFYLETKTFIASNFAGQQKSEGRTGLPNADGGKRR
jgi:phage shock protein PspC (stress-responsive transcriptional regulator)